MAVYVFFGAHIVLAPFEYSNIRIGDEDVSGTGSVGLNLKNRCPIFPTIAYPRVRMCLPSRACCRGCPHVCDVRATKFERVGVWFFVCVCFAVVVRAIFWVFVGFYVMPGLFCLLMDILGVAMVCLIDSVFCIVDKFYVFCWFLYEYFNQINAPTRNIRIRILYVRLLIFWVIVENNVFTKSLIFIISLWIAFKKLLSDTKLWKRNLSWKYFSLSKYMIFL